MSWTHLPGRRVQGRSHGQPAALVILAPHLRNGGLGPAFWGENTGQESEGLGAPSMLWTTVSFARQVPGGTHPFLHATG